MQPALKPVQQINPEKGKNSAFVSEYADFQKVHQWTTKTPAPAPPLVTPSQDLNLDLEKKSKLIAEAVNLLDSRDRQTRGSIATNMHQYIFNATENEATEKPPPKKSPSKPPAPKYKSSFRKSDLTSRNYVKEFEEKMKIKKAHYTAVANTYPQFKPMKRVTINSQNPLVRSAPPGPTMEPVSWRFKPNRTVKFGLRLDSLSEIPSENLEDKWAMKHENDPDWWRWKLKQRFIQNDELLNKLVSQRKNFEKSRMALGGIHITESMLLGRTDFSLDPVDADRTTIKDDGSWHVNLEIPARVKTRSSLVSSARVGSGATKTRGPIPTFYTPSKQLVAALLSNSTALSHDQHLKTLNKDPYLSKLLQGKDAFKPEKMMNTAREMSSNLFPHHLKRKAPVARQKLSLESLSDITEPLSPAEFVNSDVKVLYERTSEMDVVHKPKESRSVMPARRMTSNEPSDGYFNLSLLVEKGRLNGYSKLPEMKPMEASKGRRQQSSSRPATRSEKSSRAKNDSKSRNNNFGKNSGLVKMSTAANIGPDKKPGSGHVEGLNLESLPTNEWAKQIMSKARKQASSNIEASKLHQQKYMVPFDKETNLLYHEILMSKWKTDKHADRDKDDAHMRTKLVDNINKWNSGEERFRDRDKKSKGLDIWLENIREKAKRDNVITGDNT